MTAGPRPARGVDQPLGPAARLSEYAVGRDNNFNLIRLTAALSVLAGHSVAVLGLPSSREFFFDHLGLSLAEMAVDVFFVTSGFLVTGSLVSRGEVIAYLWARALRIYPAIWAMLVLTVFALAPAPARRNNASAAFFEQSAPQTASGFPKSCKTPAKEPAESSQ